MYERDNFNAEELRNKKYLRDEGIYEISLEQFNLLGNTNGNILTRYLAWDYDEQRFYDYFAGRFVDDIRIESFPQDIQSIIHNDDVRPIKYFFDENLGIRYEIQLIHVGCNVEPTPFDHGITYLF